MNVLRQLQGFFWEKRSYLFLSILCLAIATALGLVYPYLLQVLIDDAIKMENFGMVPQLALTVLGVVILKASMQFLHGFLEGGWATTSPTRCVTPATKNCNFYRSVTMTRHAPGT